MSEVNHFVAFSGGLDSTWIMYKLLSEGKFVIPVHVSVGSSSSQLVPEMLIKREMINRFNEMYPNQIVDEHYVRDPSHSLNITYGLNWKTGLKEPGDRTRDTMIQQLCVRNALAGCLIHTSPNHKFYAGWHETDIPTTFDEKYYRYLCDISPMFQIFDAKYINHYPAWGEVSPVIETPAWSKSKYEMFQELPENIRELVIVGRCIIEKVETGLQFGVRSGKIQEYKDAGVNISTHFVMPFPMLDTDIYFLYSNLCNVDGEWSWKNHAFEDLFTHCKRCVQGIGNRMRWPGGYPQWERRFSNHYSVKTNFKEPLESPLAQPVERGYVVIQENVGPGDYEDRIVTLVEED